MVPAFSHVQAGLQWRSSSQGTNRQTYIHADIAILWLNRPSGPIQWKCLSCGVWRWFAGSGPTLVSICLIKCILLGKDFSILILRFPELSSPAFFFCLSLLYWEICPTQMCFSAVYSGQETIVSRYGNILSFSLTKVRYGQIPYQWANNLNRNWI